MNTEYAIKKINEALEILDNVKKRKEQMDKTRLDKARKNTDDKLLDLFKIVKNL